MASQASDSQLGVSPVLGAGAGHTLLQSLIALIWDLPGRAGVQLLSEAQHPRSLGWGTETLALCSDEHGGRDVAAILHQLHPVVLHYPPWDGLLARPQAAVEDVVASIHMQDTSQHQETKAENVQPLHCVAESGREGAADGGAPGRREGNKVQRKPLSCRTRLHTTVLEITALLAPV